MQVFHAKLNPSIPDLSMLWYIVLSAHVFGRVLKFGDVFGLFVDPTTSGCTSRMLWAAAIIHKAR